MRINLREKLTGNKVDADILPATKNDLPLKKQGWKFPWKQLFRSDGNFQCYKLILVETPDTIEGLALFSYTDFGMLYLHQVEASPANRSNKGKYEAAGALIAYGCGLSFENSNTVYFGVLGFTSKSELVPLYQKKYFAKLYPNRLMAIEPPYSQIVIESYL